MTDASWQTPAGTSGTPLEVAQDLAAFVTASPSSFHAVAEGARRLEAAGFTRLHESDEWAGADAVTGNRYVVRDGSLIAWSTPADAGPTTPWRIVGAHTDSPALKLKPHAALASEGLAQVGVEVYGGPLLNSWLDRELLLAGRLALLDGSSVLARTGPVLRVPQLAVHLDRQVNADGLKLDPQRHLQPVVGTGEVDILATLAHAAGIDPDEVSGYDVVTADSQAPTIFGVHEEFLASGRLDNLSSTHAGLRALLDVAARPRQGGPTALLVANDHEEVGSASSSGAAGPFLEDILVRMHAALGGSEAERRQAYANSMVLSCDAGHAVHPNYPERHDPANRPRLGAGPLLKLNANQRYATDAVGTAAFERACRRAGVPFQPFVSNNAMPCGSTIGPITATRLGIRTIDAGIALLSMHSAREMCAVADPEMLLRAAEAFLTPERD